jgi:repressor LexA
MDITEKQRNVLEFINAYIKLKGYAPSYMDIAVGLNLKSKSNIHRIVHELKKRGFLQIKPHLVRSLKVVDKSVNKMMSL